MATYESILKGKYPGKAHTKRVVEYIKAKTPDVVGVIYLESQSAKLLEDTDMEEQFRQRRFFLYCTGVELADCQFIHDLSTSKSTLFIPPVDPDSVVWSGLPLSAAQALEKYDIDEVKYTTELNATLAHLGATKSDSSTKTSIYAIPGQISDSVTFLEFDNKVLSVLKEAIEVCRVKKSEYEVALIRKANAISSAAHEKVMGMVRTVENETQLEAEFHKQCMWNGAKVQAYHSIVAGGRAASTLHYVGNDQPLKGKLNMLLDAGCEWRCYASDITRTYPISGKFSPESRAIYDIVLKMQTECTNMLKAGVIWDSIHEEAHRIAIDGLLALGILKGDKKEIFDTRTSVTFFPHGLGHYMGMDVHDTGGNANYEDKDKMFRYLRVRGAVPAGSVITVEPGIYFCRYIVEPALADPVMSKYIDKAVLDKYWDVGGVRIEDNVLFTEDGFENLTPALKDPDEMEKLISLQYEWRSESE